MTVLETGQVANIINGTYTIPDVPATAQGTGPLQLTLIASFFNPTIAGPGGFPGVQEQATRTISPTSDGSPNPSFTVPILRP